MIKIKNDFYCLIIYIKVSFILSLNYVILKKIASLNSLQIINKYLRYFDKYSIINTIIILNFYTNFQSTAERIVFGSMVYTFM